MKRKGPARDVIDVLMYHSYRYNRRLNPRITPKDWEQIYGPTRAMEVKFQKELHNEQEANLRGVDNPSDSVDSGAGNIGTAR